MMAVRGVYTLLKLGNPTHIFKRPPPLGKSRLFDINCIYLIKNFNY